MNPAKSVAPYFAAYRELRAVIDAALEGRQGSVAVEGDAARLSLGCYEIFGGDPGSSAARRLVEAAASPRELVYGNDPAWRRLILEVHGERVHDRPMRDFDPSALDREALRRLEAGLPDGFELKRFDAALAATRPRARAARASGVHERGPSHRRRPGLRRGGRRPAGLRGDLLCRVR
jgi:hypothetical protein